LEHRKVEFSLTWIACDACAWMYRMRYGTRALIRIEGEDAIGEWDGSKEMPWMFPRDIEIVVTRPMLDSMTIEEMQAETRRQMLAAAGAAHRQAVLASECVFERTKF